MPWLAASGRKANTFRHMLTGVFFVSRNQLVGTLEDTKKSPYMTERNYIAEAIIAGIESCKRR